MKKFNKKVFSVVTTAALLAGVTAPFAPIGTSAVQAAAGSIQATNVPTVGEGNQALGTARVIVPAGASISRGDSVVIKAPYDLIGDVDGKNNINIPKTFSGDTNAFHGASGESDLTEAEAEEAVEAAETELDTIIENAEDDIQNNADVAAAQRAHNDALATANDLQEERDAISDVGSVEYQAANQQYEEALTDFNAKKRVLDSAKEKALDSNEEIREARRELSDANRVLDNIRGTVTTGELVTAEKTASDRITVTYNGPTTNLTEDGVFFINFGALDVDKGDTGPAEATFEASTSSAFPTGKITIANIESKGSVQVAFSSLDVSNNRFDPTINLSETVPGSFAKDGEIKVKLPSGYKWDIATPKSTVVYGDDAAKDGLTYTYNNSEDEMTINFSSSSQTSEATKLEIKPEFTVDNESKVKEGDIIARISGKTKTDISQAKIGAYGEYGSNVSVEDMTEIVSGKVEQEIGTVVIKEQINESLVENRTVTLTLPESARWNESTLGNFYSDKSVDLIYVGLTGTDDRTAKFEVRNTGSSDPAKFELENAEVSVDPSFGGDLEIEIAGSSGVEGSVVVSKVVKAIDVKTETIPNVSIGLTNQEVASFTLTEKTAGALEDGEQVRLELPDGAKFNTTPKVTIEEGDISISDVKLSSDDRAIVFTIDSDSRDASSIKVSDVKLQLDRTMPEGDVNVKVKGAAVVDKQILENYNGDDEVKKQNWNDYVSEFSIAKVATGAPGIDRGSTIFTIGSKAYSVSDVDKTMDVAPYIANDRTYLPIRYVAEAIGVSDENIVWNDAARTVTIIKGDRVAQLTIGSNILMLNGVAVPMDVNTVITNDRTFLPLSYISKALGAEVIWSDADRTVTVNR